MQKVWKEWSLLSEWQLLKMQEVRKQEWYLLSERFRDRLLALDMGSFGYISDILVMGIIYVSVQLLFRLWIGIGIGIQIPGWSPGW
ncbi:uncharacterized protein OCT59_008586 [Rhizophagus irregularis]|uniref:uncharacterized protein n=1 Tax=Rhizophagus irregularis TaxID=588596 RepID=UPI0033205482|nr:hypothetical protein OCT59_008586 [Rhizophagus irregularis]